MSQKTDRKTWRDDGVNMLWRVFIKAQSNQRTQDTEGYCDLKTQHSQLYKVNVPKKLHEKKKNFLRH